MLSAKASASLFWVKRGAPDPRKAQSQLDVPADAPAADPSDDDKPTTAGRDFWSFQPIADPKPPATQNTTWPHGPIDRFVLARLEEQGLKPVAAADRRTLIRFVRSR